MRKAVEVVRGPLMLSLSQMIMAADGGQWTMKWKRWEEEGDEKPLRSNEEEEREEEEEGRAEITSVITIIMIGILMMDNVYSRGGDSH